MIKVDWQAYHNYFFLVYIKKMAEQTLRNEQYKEDPD